MPVSSATWIDRSLPGLSLSGCERARHDFYAAAVHSEPTIPAEDFSLLAATHGFDDAWIAEQARRGFIARKPGVDGGPETITVTTKTRTRYGV